MNKWLSVLAAFLMAFSLSAQDFGTLLLSDYDDPAKSVSGVQIYLGKELLGTTDHVGAFRFTQPVKGTLTLSHPDYLSKELKIKTKKGLVTDLQLQLRQEIYDSLKTADAPALYVPCTNETTAGYYLNQPTPEFVQAVNDYLANALRYPNRARANKEQGTVVIQVVLSDKGDVICSTVLKGVSYELDKEALRVIRQVTPWKPANRNGVPVPSIHHVEVPFVLN